MAADVTLPRRMEVEADPSDPRTIRVHFDADEYIDCIEFSLEQAAELAQRLLRRYYAVEPAPPAPPLPTLLPTRSPWEVAEERARMRAAVLDWEQNVAPHLPGARRP